jgi:hypothetical protein
MFYSLGNYGSRGRVVKASDSKSDSLWERRFESCRLRELSFFEVTVLSKPAPSDNE